MELILLAFSILTTSFAAPIADNDQVQPEEFDRAVILHETTHPEPIPDAYVKSSDFGSVPYELDTNASVLDLLNHVEQRKSKKSIQRQSTKVEQEEVNNKEETEDEYEIDPAHPFVVPFSGESSFKTSLKSKIQKYRIDEQQQNQKSAKSSQINSNTVEDILENIVEEAEEIEKIEHAVEADLIIAQRAASRHIPKYLQTKEGMTNMRNSLISIVEDIRYYFERVGNLFGQAEDTILDVDDMLTNFAGADSDESSSEILNLYQRFENDPSPRHWNLNEIPGSDSGLM